MKHKKTKKFLSLAIMMGLTPIVLGSSFFVTINPNSYNVIEGGGNEGGGNEGGGNEGGGNEGGGNEGGGNEGGGNEGGGNEGGGTNPPIEPEKPLIPSKLWLEFIQGYGEHLNIKNMNEFNSNNASISLSSKSLTNINLPQEDLGLESPFNLYFQTNKLTNFEFLNGLKHVRGNLYLYRNDITNLKGLNKLEKVDNTFYLTNLNMTTINELMSLKSVSILRLYNNPNLNNLIGLSNLEKGKVFIDDYSKYKYKPNMNSAFCKNLVRGNITVEQYGNPDIQYNARNLCTNFNSSWLDKIQSYGEHLNIKNMNEFNSNNASISLSSKSLTNASLPKENLGLESPFNLYFQTNKLTNFEFLNGLKYIRGNLYLYRNDIMNLKGLNELEKVESTLYLTNLNMENINELMSLKSVGTLRLYNNPNLNNLIGLSNLEKGKVIIDDYLKYKYKPNMNSAFCKNLVRGNITVEQYGNPDIQYNARNLCTNFNSSWLDKIQSYGEHLNIKNMNEFNSNNASISLSSKSLTNASLPKENLGLESPFNLYFQSNKLTNFEFLNGLKYVRGNLYLYKNDITNLKGLNELEKVESNFYLTNLNMTNINELMSLKSVSTLRLYNNPKLNNLIGLSNLEKGNVIIDDYSKYNYKPNMNSAFCKNLVRGNITVERYGNTTIQYNARDLCTNFNSSWLDKIQSYGENLNIKNMNEFNSNNASISLSSKSLTNASLPKENLGLESPFNLYFQSNKLTNFEFLNGLKHVRGNLYLYRNDITNLKGLNELEKVESNFYLTNLNMTNINELMSLKSVGTLRLYNNPNLNNLIGLSNLEKGKVMIDDYSKYKYKPNMNSAFCKNLSNKNITVEKYGNSNIQYTTKELCD